MMKISVVLFQNLRDKIGVGEMSFDLPDGSTLRDLKNHIYSLHPKLNSHLENILVLMGKKIIVDNDLLQNGTTISFLTPIGGG